MASSVKWAAKRAPSPDSADSVNSFNKAANSSPVMSPPVLLADRKLVGGRHYHISGFGKVFRARASFRGFRHHRHRHARPPAIDEFLQPGALGHVAHRAVGEGVIARPRARQFEPRMAARGPAMHHRVGHVGMKLEAEGMVEPKRLDRKVAALREQFGAGRKLKSLAVPVV